MVLVNADNEAMVLVNADNEAIAVGAVYTAGPPLDHASLVPRPRRLLIAALDLNPKP